MVPQLYVLSSQPIPHVSGMKRKEDGREHRWKPPSFTTLERFRQHQAATWRQRQAQALWLQGFDVESTGEKKVEKQHAAPIFIHEYYFYNWENINFF